MTAPTPTYWPGTTIVKSQHNAFHIALTRSATSAPTPAGAKAPKPGEKAQTKPKAAPNPKANPKGGSGGFKGHGGTLHGPGTRTARLLQPKPNLMRHMSNAAPLRPIAQASHNGAYSRAAAGKASAPTPPKGKAATTTGATTP